MRSNAAESKKTRDRRAAEHFMTGMGYLRSEEAMLATPTLFDLIADEALQASE